MRYVTKEVLKKVYKRRKPWVRKHDFGNLLIIGGSKLYPTTPILPALAAYRAGVDWVTIAAPSEACKVIASYSPNLMVHPLEGSHLRTEHVRELLTMSERRTAVEIGGGLTRAEKVLKAVLHYLELLDKPCVIDDDAIYAVSKKRKLLRDKPFVILPHTYEFYVLSGFRVTTNLKERAGYVKRVASKLRTTILLKGHIDVISDGKRVLLNKTGTPLMTKQGFGNTLAGICASMLARGVEPFTAACASAYVNGMAGELAGKAYSEGLLPTDLIEAIPAVVRSSLVQANPFNKQGEK